MTRALDPVLAELREKLMLMASRAESILDKSVRALVERDAGLAAQVAEDDLAIDRLDVELDSGVLRALALQAPVAADLRQVMAIKLIAIDLERVGDLARDIAQSATALARPPRNVSAPPVLVDLARAAGEMLRSSVDAYARCDAQLAQRVLDQDDAVDATHDEVLQRELDEITRHPGNATGAIALIRASTSLERVADHATNIAEDVILVAEARNVKHAGKLGGPSQL